MTQTRTFEDIRSQVAASLGDWGNEYNIQDIVAAIIAEYGLVNIDQINDAEYWDLVGRCEVPENDRLALLVAALRNSDIDYRVIDGGAEDTFIVADRHGSEVAFGVAAETGAEQPGPRGALGYNLAFYDGPVADGEVGSEDWEETASGVVDALREWLA